jgi:hypothetical protein
MMGQQQQTVTASGSALRRLVLALLVTTLMAATMALNAMPAFAASEEANPIGREISLINNEVGHGTGGKALANSAQEGGGVGDIASEKRKNP